MTKARELADSADRGPIKNEDVADDAAIAQSKVDGLTSDLAKKADSSDLAKKLDRSNPSFAGRISGPHISIGKPDDLWTDYSVTVGPDLGQFYSPGAYRLAITSNGHRNVNNQWTSNGVNGLTGAAEVAVDPTGAILFNVESNKATGSGYPIANQVTIEEGRFYSSAVYNYTSTAGPNVFIETGAGAQTQKVLKRSTSSIKYKKDVETLQDSSADKVFDMRPVWFRSTANGDQHRAEWSHYGLIAEEVAEIDPRLVSFANNEDGSLEPEGVQYDRLVPHLINIVQRQREQIEALSARLDAAGI